MLAVQWYVETSACWQGITGADGFLCIPWSVQQIEINLLITS